MYVDNVPMYVQVLVLVTVCATACVAFKLYMVAGYHRIPLCKATQIKWCVPLCSYTTNLML